MSTIEILQEATRPECMTPEMRALRQKADPYWDAVKKAFSCRFVDEMWDAECAALELDITSAYRRGFRDAFQLWMEVFSRYSS